LISPNANKTVTDKQLRSFSLITFLGFGVLALFAWRKQNLFLMLLLIALQALILLGQFYLPLLLRFYAYWMKIGEILGWLSSRLLLSLIFYLIVTPIGLFLRIIKKTLLDLRFPDAAASFWRKRKKTHTDLTKMF